MAADPMPAAEVRIDVDVVRALVVEQHPDLATLDLHAVGEGWDNVTFRLGPDLAVRLPRRALAAPLVIHEQTWLPQLAPRLPLPIPAPVRVGRPGCGYPWSWSIVPWFEGETADVAVLADPRAAGATLGAFLRALHVAAPVDAPVNPYRGVPLAERHDLMVARLEQLSDTVDAPRVRALWDDLCATPKWEGAPVWIHGDLHPANLVVRAGRLCAVVDFGDITAGDPATDMAGGIMLFAREEQPALREALAAFRQATGRSGDDDLWRRARGWALTHGVMCLASSADNPSMEAMGRRTLAAALADE